MKQIERLLCPCPSSTALRAWTPGEEQSPAWPQVQLTFRVMIYFGSYGHALSQENWGLLPLPKDLHLQWFIHLKSESNSFLKIFFSIGQLAHCWKEALPKCVYTHLYSQRVHGQIHRTIFLASSTVLMPMQRRRQFMGNNLSLGSQSLLELWNEDCTSRNQLLFKGRKIRSKKTHPWYSTK